MGGRDRQIDDDRDVRIAQQFLNRANPGNAVAFRLFPCPGQIQIGAGRKLELREFAAVFHVNAADFTAADDANLDFFHYWLSPIPV